MDLNTEIFFNTNITNQKTQIAYYSKISLHKNILNITLDLGDLSIKSHMVIEMFPMWAYRFSPCKYRDLPVMVIEIFLL